MTTTTTTTTTTDTTIKTTITTTITITRTTAPYNNYRHHHQGSTHTPARTQRAAGTHRQRTLSISSSATGSKGHTAIAPDATSSTLA
ncbi:hypothetical protein E2C01_058066 [Portunus trituberculatus]|uniref:Uncharacterized protein n=1 Tax=Portunus trituberculatus TaxID=210409 RepID=A0A5B7H4A6_PORTR|nr:hypothetical protein [Portunus trituberculatus]